MAVIKKFDSTGAVESEVVISTAKGARERADRAGVKIIPMNVEGLARVEGLAIQRRPLADDISGFLRKINGTWTIGVNSNHHPRRQRFTIAHELGHYYLHLAQRDEFEDTLLFRSEQSNPMEWEANRFAAQLLMPKKEFQALVSDGVLEVRELADRFNVSGLAVKVRAKELGFVKNS